MSLEAITEIREVEERTERAKAEARVQAQKNSVQAGRIADRNGQLLAYTDEELPENYLLITADTMVLLDNKPFHKPADRDQAIRTLYALSGQTHKVITGLSLRTKTRNFSMSVESKVTFRVFSLEEIEYYVDTYKPYDKAGAYGIQEWIGYVGIEAVEGSFYNVMGLPTQRLYRVLSEWE